MYAGGKVITFVVEDVVWLSARNLRTLKPLKIIDYKRTELYMVSKIMNKNA